MDVPLPLAASRPFMSCKHMSRIKSNKRVYIERTISRVQPDRERCPGRPLACICKEVVSTAQKQQLGIEKVLYDCVWRP